MRAGTRASKNAKLKSSFLEVFSETAWHPAQVFSELTGDSVVSFTLLSNIELKINNYFGYTLVARLRTAHYYCIERKYGHNPEKDRPRIYLNKTIIAPLKEKIKPHDRSLYQLGNFFLKAWFF